MSHADSPLATRAPAAPELHPVLQEVAEALRGLRFGSVELTVHEGRVTLIERKEKLRLA